MPVQNTVKDYAGRQIDIELLQTITKPQGVVKMNISTIASPPKVVAGIQKALQRYTLLFLSAYGDIAYAPLQGTQFGMALNKGAIYDRTSVQTNFAAANNLVLRQLQTDDNLAATFGAIPDDERIVAVQLTDFNVDYATATVLLIVQVTTQAGTTVDYVLPATTIGG